MVGFDGEEVDAIEVELILPVGFADAGKAARNERARVEAGDDLGVFVSQSAEGGSVEVVEVGVAEEDEVEGWEGCGIDGRREARDAESDGAGGDADAMGEDGVSENPAAVEVQQDGGVAEPHGGEVGRLHAFECLRIDGDGFVAAGFEGAFESFGVAAGGTLGGVGVVAGWRDADEAEETGGGAGFGGSARFVGGCGQVGLLGGDWELAAWEVSRKVRGRFWAGGVVYPVPPRGLPTSPFSCGLAGPVSPSSHTRPASRHTRPAKPGLVARMQVERNATRRISLFDDDAIRTHRSEKRGRTMPRASELRLQVAVRTS